ncbi:hypothetical protein HAX54_047351, partial [Datura stramonium]|nr:hypothetical protein [Datura stramonium]
MASGKMVDEKGEEGDLVVRLVFYHGNGEERLEQLASVCGGLWLFFDCWWSDMEGDEEERMEVGQFFLVWWSEKRGREEVGVVRR